MTLTDLDADSKGLNKRKEKLETMARQIEATVRSSGLGVRPRTPLSYPGGPPTKIRYSSLYIQRLQQSLLPPRRSPSPPRWPSPPLPLQRSSKGDSLTIDGVITAAVAKKVADTAAAVAATASKEKKLRNLVAFEVVKMMEEYGKPLATDRDVFKKHAEKLTRIIVEKEKKSSSYGDLKLEAHLPDETVTKIADFSKEYIPKLLRALKKTNHEPSLAGPHVSTSLEISDSTVILDVVLPETTVDSDGLDATTEVEQTLDERGAQRLLVESSIAGHSPAPQAFTPLVDSLSTITTPHPVTASRFPVDPATPNRTPNRSTLAFRVPFNIKSITSVEKPKEGGRVKLRSSTTTAQSPR
ncbi:hypothetical protein B0H11DRAFT_2231723 [Mycena galericulata]|nr:hypothetical protein B0H11DRAFT_2238299 [Mycena galericulata]KAJ7483993.1 hypothetical protein B0H11DRAFT_2231723 [Mycena galericulata]